MRTHNRIRERLHWASGWEVKDRHNLSATLSVFVLCRVLIREQAQVSRE